MMHAQPPHPQATCCQRCCPQTAAALRVHPLQDPWPAGPGQAQTPRHVPALQAQKHCCRGPRHSMGCWFQSRCCAAELLASLPAGAHKHATLLQTCLSPTAAPDHSFMHH